MRISWGIITSLTPLINNNPIPLADSFIVEFDFIIEKYILRVDTITNAIKTRSKDSAVLEWPYVNYGTGSYFERPEVFKDTIRKFPVAVHSGSFNYQNWHHCMLLYSNKKVSCYIINPKPFIAFTDTAFSFLHISMGKQDNILCKSISVKKAARGNHSGNLFKDNQITYSAHFDTDKAIIKEEDAPFLNGLVKMAASAPGSKAGDRWAYCQRG